MSKDETQQIRLFLTLPKRRAEAVYSRADMAFEEEGWPLVLFDNEAEGVYEISLYVPANAAETAKMRLAAAADLPQTAILHEALPQKDWVKESLAALKPVRAGSFFIHGAHDRDKMRKGDIGIEIEANRAFGTGHHGTTAACLEMLEQIIAREKPHNILDIGTGSGILAIAAAKLGNSAVLATDNDATAIEIANENKVINHVSEEVAAICAVGFDSSAIRRAAPFSLIIANILAGPLIAMAGDMRKFAQSGGSLLLSGILARQEQSVLEAYRAQGFRHSSTLEKAGWVALHLRKDPQEAENTDRQRRGKQKL